MRLKPHLPWIFELIRPNTVLINRLCSGQKEKSADARLSIKGTRPNCGASERTPGQIPRNEAKIEVSRYGGGGMSETQQMAAFERPVNSRRYPCQLPRRFTVIFKLIAKAIGIAR